MKAIRPIYRLFFAIILISISFGHNAVSAKSSNTLHLDVMSIGKNETVLELTIDGFTAETVQINGQSYQRIVIDQTIQSANVGEPQVPIYSALIGVPDPENISLQVIDKNSVSYQEYNLPFIEEIGVVGDNFLDQQAEVQVKTTNGNENKYSGEYLPNRLAEISQSGYLRDQGFVQITFYPVQYSAERQEIIFNKHIVVKVTSNSGTDNSRTGHRGNQPEFESLLKNSLVNYPDLDRPVAKAEELAISGENQKQTNAALNPALKITITQEGLYQLTYDDMILAGFDPSDIDSSTLKLTNRGSEVAILVENGGDGHIDNPGDRILFFGEALNNVYTSKNIYWLTYSSGPGKRMIEQSGLPGDATIPDKFRNLLHAEEDTYYWQTMPWGEGQDHWFWGGRLSPNTQGMPNSRTYTVWLENISDSQELVANLHFVLKGGTNDWTYNPNHHIRVYINDHLVNDWYWYGYDILDVNQDITQSSFLVEGPNTVTFECVAIPDVLVDQIFVNWFEITYWDTYQAENNQSYFHAPSSGDYKFQVRGFADPLIHVFDITDPLNAITFTNLSVLPDGSGYKVEFQDTALASDRYLAINESQYLPPESVELDVPSSWKTPGHAADYVLITYDGFYNNVGPLADYRTSQGLRVEIVKVQDLYDEFNYGIFNPSAIRDFLIYAYQYWQSPAPLYVLLVGDAYYDYKDNLNSGFINYVPTQIVETTALGETPSDNWFARVVGDDVLPDMFIGRLSAQSTSEVDTIVQKIIQYERDQDPSSWGTDALFVADDDESMFETDSDGFANLLPRWYEVQKIYVAHYDPSDPTQNPTQDIIDTINSGTMMVNYLGHGAVYQWGVWDSRGNILDNTSVSLMNNPDKLAFISIESCLNGFFIGPQSKYSLAEALQRHSAGGAVAVWAPSGLSFSNAHQVLINELYKTLFRDEIYGLGQAITLTKWNVYSQNSIWKDLVNIYILFGDPATKLGAEDISHEFIPIIKK